MSLDTASPLFGAAMLKLSFWEKGQLDMPGFTYVYNGVLRELGVTGEAVDRYIEAHETVLMDHMQHRRDGR